jgi:iron transport multicopper oxidase
LLTRKQKGNGEGHTNTSPAKGSSALTTFDECIINFAVSSTGSISVTDYFEPSDYVALDNGDQDLGSGGIALLDNGTFSGTGVAQMGVVVGKTGKIYVVNADNLGGFAQGDGGGDAVVQTLQLPSGVWGGCGSYSLEVSFDYFIFL